MLVVSYNEFCTCCHSAVNKLVVIHIFFNKPEMDMSFLIHSSM